MNQRFLTLFHVPHSLNLFDIENVVQILPLAQRKTGASKFVINQRIKKTTLARNIKNKINVHFNFLSIHIIKW